MLPLDVRTFAPVQRIRQAVEGGSTSELQAVLGSTPNAASMGLADSDASTPLHWAAKQRDTTALGLLLQAGF